MKMKKIKGTCMLVGDVDGNGVLFTIDSLRHTNTVVSITMLNAKVNIGKVHIKFEHGKLEYTGEINDAISRMKICPVIRSIKSEYQIIDDVEVLVVEQCVILSVFPYRDHIDEVDDWDEI